MDNYSNYSQKSKNIDFLLINTKSDIPRISRHTFSPVITHKYPQLELFRKQIRSSGELQTTYFYNKKQVMLYKWIFYSLASLFGFLGCLTFLIPSALSCGFIGSCFIFKSIIIVLSFVLSIASFSIGYKIQTETESVMYQVRQAQLNAAKLYARKRFKLGLKRFFIFSQNQKQAALLKQMYRDTCEKINDKKEEALSLIQRISQAPLELKDKEVLYNQTIGELHDKLTLLTHTFKNCDFIKPNVH